MKTPIIQVRQVRRVFRSPKKDEGFKGAMKLLFNPEYSEHEALKGITFDIEPGSFNGLIGANGAGKTTLLKILSGLIPPTTGSATVLGFDPFKRPVEFRRKISLVMGQKAQLWWDLPAIDAFELLQAIYEIPKKTYQERVNELADLLDVKRLLQTQIRRLSLGERMKMELIGALIHWPEVIFLDEPTIGLDVFAAHKLREFLKTFNAREKATIILTSHNMDDIERLCSRVLIIREGELIYDGKPDGLTDSGEVRLRVRLTKNPEISDLVKQTSIPAQDILVDEESESESESEDGIKNIRFRIKQPQIISVLQGLMAHHQVVEMGIEEQSLESVIQKIYSEKTIPTQSR